MCNLHDLLQLLPKCEHHLHLEGTLTPETLFKLAAKNSISLPSNDPAFSSPSALAARYAEFSSLDDFLQYYYIGMSVLLDSSDYEILAWEYFQRAQQDGVVHVECFFDPQAHLSRGVSYETILTGFMKSRRRAESELGITSQLICCFLRHLPPSDAMSTFLRPAVQQSFAHKEVLGIGLDSSELDFPPPLFAHLYAAAKKQGLRRTAHAGEEGPPEYIRLAIDDLGVERIDHGIRLIEDPSLLKQVAERGTLLTICPISNVFLRCVRSVKDLPIRRYLDVGVKFSINSDDPAYFGNNFLLDNYCAVQDAFVLSIEEWRTVCQNSIDGSWCSSSRKDQMRARLDAAIKTWISHHPEDRK